MIDAMLPTHTHTPNRADIPFKGYAILLCQCDCVTVQ